MTGQDGNGRWKYLRDDLAEWKSWKHTYLAHSLQCPEYYVHLVCTSRRYNGCWYLQWFRDIAMCLDCLSHSQHRPVEKTPLLAQFGRTKSLINSVASGQTVASMDIFAGLSLIRFGSALKNKTWNSDEQSCMIERYELNIRIAIVRLQEQWGVPWRMIRLVVHCRCHSVIAVWG